jgi:hypothetical protein
VTAATRETPDGLTAQRIYNAGKLITAQRLRILEVTRAGRLLAEVDASDGGRYAVVRRPSGAMSCGCETAVEHRRLRPPDRGPAGNRLVS